MQRHHFEEDSESRVGRAQNCIVLDWCVEGVHYISYYFRIPGQSKVTTSRYTRIYTFQHCEKIA